MNASIAAYGWQHRGWSGSYYPDDLPEEWRLAFYANEFRAVVVPESTWRDADADRIAAWAGETGAGFRFLLEAAASGDEPGRAGELLGDRFGGVLLRADGDLTGVPVVRWPEPGAVTAGNGLVAACWAGGADPRGLRAALESLIPGMRAGDSGLLIVTGEPPAIEAMRAAEVIAGLLAG